jgi:hypothetical protein
MQLAFNFIAQTLSSSVVQHSIYACVCVSDAGSDNKEHRVVMWIAQQGESTSAFVTLVTLVSVVGVAGADEPLGDRFTAIFCRHGTRLKKKSNQGPRMYM